MRSAFVNASVPVFGCHDVKMEWVCLGGDAFGIRPEIAINSDVALVASDSAPTNCANATTNAYRRAQALQRRSYHQAVILQLICSLIMSCPPADEDFKSATDRFLAWFKAGGGVFRDDLLEIQDLRHKEAGRGISTPCG